MDHAEDLLIGGLSPRRAEQELARRYGVSARQARRYLAKVRMRWDAERRLDDSGVVDPLDAEFARLDHALESDDVSVALRGVRRMNNFLVGLIRSRGQSDYATSFMRAEHSYSAGLM